MSKTVESVTELMQYDSILIPGKKVDISNYVTEIIFQRRYNKLRRDIPKVEFWRKEYEAEASFKELRNDYIAELTQVKKLLKVFCPEVVAKYAKEADLWSLRYIKKGELPAIITELFRRQLEHITALRIKASEVERAVDKVEYIQNQTVKRTNNILSKGI